MPVKPYKGETQSEENYSNSMRALVKDKDTGHTNSNIKFTLYNCVPNASSGVSICPEILIFSWPSFGKIYFELLPPSPLKVRDLLVEQL